MRCQTKIKGIGGNGSADTQRQESAVRENVQMALAMKLQTISREFRAAPIRLLGQ